MNTILMILLGVVPSPSHFNFTCMLQSNGLLASDAQKIGACVLKVKSSPVIKQCWRASPPADKTLKKAAKITLQCGVNYQKLMSKAVLQSANKAGNTAAVTQMITSVTTCLNNSLDYRTCDFPIFASQFAVVSPAISAIFTRLAGKYEGKCSNYDACTVWRPSSSSNGGSTASPSATSTTMTTTTLAAGTTAAAPGPMPTTGASTSTVSASG